jgi:putative ABC transport system permease protein
VTLALGAGGTAAIFSVVRTLLLERLPVVDEEQLGVFWFDGSWNETEFLHLRPNFPGFKHVAAYRPGDTTLQIHGEALRMVGGVTVSAELFEVLGTAPLLGRTFRTGEDLPGAEPSAIISHRLWQELGGDPSIVGQQLSLGGANRTILGVMPPGFWFPSPATQVWVAGSLNPQRGVGEYALLARIDDGQRIDRMQGPLGRIASELGRQFRYPAQWDKTQAPSITPLREYLLGDVRPGLLATLAAMALILLIACGNVATLMLGQVGGRSTEMAVRAAVGAGRQRLIQQITIEALLLGALAGAVGAVLAAAGFGILVRSLPLGELADTARLDWTVFWASAMVGLLASVGIAIVAGTALWRGELQGTLSTTRTGGMSVRGGRLESGLVVAQIALAVLLTAGAGLLIRSVANLRGIDPGVDVRAVAVIDVTAPSQMTADQRRRAYLTALPALQALPGVRAAAATQKPPLRGKGDDWSVRIVGRPDFDGITTYVRVVTDDYFQALGIDIRQGRGFLPTDRASAQRVVVINEAFAAKYFTSENPLGRMLNSGFDDAGERIVGVVENVAEADLTDGPVAARYMLYEHVGNAILPSSSFVIRASAPGDVVPLLQAAQSTLRREVPQLAVNGTTTMQAVFDKAVGPTGQVVTLVTLLAGLALLLGAIGVYGVMSHFVSRRMRDYGIYITLGLPPGKIMLQVLRRGGIMVALGSLIGVIAAIALTGVLSSLLYGVGATDPAAFAAAVVALSVAGTLAALIPARRASLSDPAVLLRQQ